MNTFVVSMLCLLVVVPSLLAQSDASDSVAYGWTNDLVAGLTLTQVAQKDWVQGGEDAFSYTGLVTGSSVDDQRRMNWTTDLVLAFGQTRLGEGGLRKTDDKIDLSSVVLYKLYENSKLNPFAAATFKTQFANGFTYDSVGAATQVSTFFDPAYITQSIGAAYRPGPEFRTRLGAALREVITNQFNQYADDPATPEIESVLVEGGLESVSNLKLQLDDNVLLKSELNLFAPFDAFDRVVTRGTAEIAAEVNSYITVLLSLEALNDARVSPRTQLRESLAIGLRYRVLGDGK